MSRTFIMLVLAIPLLIGVFYFVKLMFPEMPQDGKVEEAIEQVIEDNTNIKIDLTPNSPEQKSM